MDPLQERQVRQASKRGAMLAGVAAVVFLAYLGAMFKSAIDVYFEEARIDTANRMSAARLHDLFHKAHPGDVIVCRMQGLQWDCDFDLPPQ